MPRVTFQLPKDCLVTGLYAERLTLGWNVFCGDDRLNQFPVLTLDAVSDFLMAYYNVKQIRVLINGEAS